MFIGILVNWPFIKTLVKFMGWSSRPLLSSTVQPTCITGIMVLIMVHCSSSTSNALWGRKSQGRQGFVRGLLLHLYSHKIWPPLQRSNRQINPLSSNQTGPLWWNHPMVYHSQWPLVMTCDLYGKCFKQRDISEPALSLPLSVSLYGVMWDNWEAFGRRETWHPSLGSHKMATMSIVSPAAV